MVRGGGDFALFPNPKLSIVIPKRAFTADQTNEFRELLRQHVQTAIAFCKSRRSSTKPEHLPRSPVEHTNLSPLHPAQPFQRPSDQPRPRRHLIIAQCALAGLELRSHQDRVLAGANFFSAEDFYWDETASSVMLNLLTLS